MKWMFVFFLLLAGCTVADDLNKAKALGNPILTIRNQASGDFLFVRWIDTYGNTEWYCSDNNIYCAVDGHSDHPGMALGNSFTYHVTAGTGKVYLYFPYDSSFTEYRTVTSYTLTNGGTYTITLLGSTLLSH